MSYAGTHEYKGSAIRMEADIEQLYDHAARAQNAIMGLCVAMMMHVIGTYLIVRRIKRG